jgi:hypothetical protein
MSWTITVLIICCLVAAFAVWKEYGRANRSHLLLRISASLLAVGAFACIALPISYSKNVIGQDNHSAILLTAGFERDSLANYKSNELFTNDNAIAKTYSQAKLIRLDELKTDSPAITQLHLFGYGLNADELKELNHLPVIFHPASAPKGITAVNWNQRLKAGEALRVQGKYKNDRSQPVKLVLKGLNTQLDTLTIPAKSNKDFELTAVPKNGGKSVYHLQTIAGADTLTNESLPIEIDAIQPLQILILSASPDFETKFLKNWLSENGFSVAVRSAISKDKFSSEYVNMQPLKLDHLSPALLDKFDLVIGDLSVLKSEGTLLKEQVIQKGSGVIIRNDSLSKTGSWLQNDFPLERSNTANQPQVALIIKGKTGKSVPLKIDPVFIRLQNGTQPLVNDVQGRLLVNSALAGSGRLTFTTVNNTFNWMLAGDKDDYADFWSLLISKTARKGIVTGNWLASTLPTVDQPLQFQLETSLAPGQISMEHSVAAPVQNPLIPFEWDNTYWPTAAGWHSIRQNNGQPAWCYVYDKDEWQGVKAFEKITKTRRYAKTNAVGTTVTKQIHEKMRIDVPKIYFYLVLLVACSFLWVEGKGLTLPSSKERV